MSKVSKVCLILALAFGAEAQAPKYSIAQTREMALIPGATFEMGQNGADIPKLQEMFRIKRAAMFADEVPKHKTLVASFFLDKTEVTNLQFRRFVERFPEWQKDKVVTAYHNGKYLQQWHGNDFPAGQGSFPVVYVSWYAANAFCLAQGKRLPTEAEWEFAARGGYEGKAFPWGDEMPDKSRANYSETGLNAATAVGSYPANGYGLFDMAGNVWEYLADEWQKYPAKTADQVDASNYLQVKTRRTIRGGSYGAAPVNMRVTFRDSHLPENAGDHVGFRCAMTAPEQSKGVNELLRLHYQGRASHFARDARSMVGGFADDFTDIRNGTVNKPTRETSLSRFQNYLDNSTFIEWDDITPPIVSISDDATMGYVVVHKKVRLLAKQTNGSEREETEVFAWIAVYRKIKGEWKLVVVASTNTPDKD